MKARTICAEGMRPKSKTCSKSSLLSMEWLGRFRFATQVERLHAGLEPLRRQELEVPRTRQAMKQRRPAATDDGMNDDAVLVDEPQLLERGRELVRSDQDTPLGLRLQRRDRLAK